MKSYRVEEGQAEIGSTHDYTEIMQSFKATLKRRQTEDNVDLMAINTQLKIDVT